jgi:Holliday junction resolvasome RuvABC endonuclease subunit
MYRTLVLDPAISTGYAVLVTRGNESEIIDYGFIDINNSTAFEGDACIEMIKRVHELIDKYSIDTLAIEDFFFGSSFTSGANLNVYLRAAIFIAARQRSLPYWMVNTSAWKKFVAGRSTPSKEHKKKWGKEAAKKLYIQEALWTNFGIRFPNHSISSKTGKPIMFRYDIVDAVGQAVYTAAILRKSTSIKCSVPIPDDVPIRAGKKRFIY